MNLNMTVGQAACQLLCRYTRRAAATSRVLLIRTDCVNQAKELVAVRS